MFKRYEFAIIDGEYKKAVDSGDSLNMEIGECRASRFLKFDIVLLSRCMFGIH